LEDPKLEKQKKQESSKPERDFISNVFMRLKKAGALYCVLRNYDDLPERAGNDIDIMVSREHVKAFEDHLMAASADSGWCLLKKPVLFGYGSYWFRSVNGNIIHFDVWSLFTWKGLRWASEKSVLTGRRQHGEIYVPSLANEAAILLLKDLVQNGEVKEKYKDFIERIASEHSHSFTEFLSWALGKELAREVSEKVVSGRWSEVSEEKRRIRMAVILKALARDNLKAILGAVNFLFYHIKSFFLGRNGFFLVFIGPDGSGKSTTAEEIKKSLAELFPRAHYYHGRFGSIPELKWYIKLIKNAKEKEIDPENDSVASLAKIPPHGRFRAVFYLLYYSIDYLLGYGTVLRARSMGQLVIFDRYFYDYFILGIFTKVPSFFFRICHFILPKPDLLVYLHNSPEVIHQRKPELTIDEIKHQNIACQRIVNKLPFALEIVTNRELEEITEDISNNIIKIMDERGRGK